MWRRSHVTCTHEFRNIFESYIKVCIADSQEMCVTRLDLRDTSRSITSPLYTNHVTSMNRRGLNDSWCCSVLIYVLQRVTMCIAACWECALQTREGGWFVFVKCAAVCYSVLQCVVLCCSVLQCVAVRCSVLQCVALAQLSSWAVQWWFSIRGTFLTITLVVINSSWIRSNKSYIDPQSTILNFCNTDMDWCCCHSFIRNSPEPLLETVFACEFFFYESPHYSYHMVIKECKSALRSLTWSFNLQTLGTFADPSCQDV